ncbi:PREDICTED: cytospin-B isoform X3 [Chinchilla lanigera]|uniref:cytospin-B isoform X3 n=1 Tax=Chinchilla lanigera TaxID=34839 RepID=UPI0006973A1B|nr:PREDICTED: cytospin-B isoform X3 [Chinchilla lanigera]
MCQPGKLRASGEGTEILIFEAFPVASSKVWNFLGCFLTRFVSYRFHKREPLRTNMRSAAKPWSPVVKAGTHGCDRARPLPAASSGMKSSKSSTSLAFESRLSKLKRASSEDMLNKPGSTSSSGVVRLKKTATAGAISELAESRLRTTTVPTAKRTGIPTPRELSVAVSRERSVSRGPSNPRKSGSSPTSSCTHTPTKHLRTTSAKLKQESEGGEKAVLESQVRELLAEAKAKDSEINRLRSELKKCKERRALSTEGTDASDPSSDGTAAPSGGTEPLIRTLEEKNKTFQKELADLEEENRVLKEKLTYLEQSPNSEGAASHTGDSSCPTSITQDSSFGSPNGNELSSEIDEYKENTYGNTLRTSGSSSSDVTKASLSPDASDFEHITTDTLSRPLSSASNPFKNSKCSTTVSSPNNVSELSLASLTEKIQKMEENHHSTAEELQATLQELSDQQQMVQELTAENEKLVDEKTILETSFHQHRERAEQLSQENEKLINLLQERVKNDESSTQEGKILELEQKCTDILEKSRFEREKLLNIQQQLTCSLRKVEEENQGALDMIKHLKEENEKLNGFLEVERCNSNAMTTTLEECRVTLEGLKMENGSLKAHLEGEKQKAMEPSSTLGQTAENCELQEMLKVARAEKDQLELSCTELRQELLKANGEIKHISSLLAKMEKDYSYLKEICDHQAEQLSRTSLKLQEKASESDAEIKDMKETIFELEDQVEQHRAVKLHNNQLISELESNVIKLEEQKSDLERQLKTLTKQIKEETEEWRRFQADLQTAVVVANDIKCEAQQELRTVKRRLLEEEEKNAKLQKELGDMQGHSRPVNEEPEPLEVNTAGRWHGVYVNRTSPAPSESAATVKSLIKSFDLGHPGGTAQNISIHKAPRSPLSGIPVRTTPAAAVSPMQRHSTYGLRPANKGLTQRLDIPDLPLSDLLKGRTEDLKPDPYLRKSPSLESLSRPPSLGFGSTRLLSASAGGLKPPSKLSVERRDPLAALAREYGGSKRNALLKWCQKKTEGYAKRNLLLAFEAAESVGIKPSLELSEMLYTDRPDWQSVMQYVAQIYKYFET